MANNGISDRIAHFNKLAANNSPGKLRAPPQTITSSVQPLDLNEHHTYTLLELPSTCMPPTPSGVNNLVPLKFVPDSLITTTHGVPAEFLEPTILSVTPAPESPTISMDFASESPAAPAISITAPSVDPEASLPSNPGLSIASTVESEMPAAPVEVASDTVVVQSKDIEAAVDALTALKLDADPVHLNTDECKVIMIGNPGVDNSTLLSTNPKPLLPTIPVRSVVAVAESAEAALADVDTAEAVVDVEVLKSGVDQTANPSGTDNLRRKVIMIGNPGVGKSTLLSSLVKGNKSFQSGVAIGKGMTSEFQEISYNGTIYVDTPGFSDIKLREVAAKEIATALSKGGKFKVIKIFQYRHNITCHRYSLL